MLPKFNDSAIEVTVYYAFAAAISPQPNSSTANYT